MSQMTPPDALGTAGASLWSSIVGKYELRPDELVVLERACHARDRIDAMEKERAGAVMSTGSMGQPVAHPLIAEVRMHEALVAQQLAKLRLPDEDGGAVSPRSVQARDAARSRWSTPHGASA